MASSNFEVTTIELEKAAIRGNTFEKMKVGSLALEELQRALDVTGSLNTYFCFSAMSIEMAIIAAIAT